MAASCQWLLQAVTEQQALHLDGRRPELLQRIEPGEAGLSAGALCGEDGQVGGFAGFERLTVPRSRMPFDLSTSHKQEPSP